jgi:nucleotide-binding universal stress UspA family protein
LALWAFLYSGAFQQHKPMSEDVPLAQYAGAVEDFRRARRDAILEQIVSRLSGRSADLLSYEQVRQQLRPSGRKARVRREVPLDAIVGSVGRYSDFTRSFLPKRGRDEGRWARVKVRASGLAGLPPIEVYQIGEAYFVRDGHHRVSVARRLGATRIEAYVTEVQTKVSLSPDAEPDDLILKAEYTAFLEHTHLDELRPEADLEVTVPGQYEILEEHVSVHRYFMGLEQDREIPYDEAVIHWYDTYYLPVVEVIRSTGILRDFPGRTEADLYLWVLEHRAALTEELGWEVRPELAATDMAARFSRTLERVLQRVRKQVLDIATPEGLAGGPPVGAWRQERSLNRPPDRLFAEILVAIDGTDGGWHALEWATGMAHHEAARLYGLHVVSSEAQQESEAVRTIQVEFGRRCYEAGISGTLALGVGQVSRVICERARMMDLVVLGLSHPYAPGFIARLGSGLHAIIQRCPVPVVAVPTDAVNLDRVLLAYDGSPKAAEALFVATYLAGRWDVPLLVLTVMEEGVAEEMVAYALTYAEEHGVQAAHVEKQGPVAEAILLAAEEADVDLIVTGGYGSSPMVEWALGSTVEEVLQSSRWPVLVCQ